MEIMGWQRWVSAIWFELCEGSDLTIDAHCSNGRFVRIAAVYRLCSEGLLRLPEFAPVTEYSLVLVGFNSF